MLAAYPRIDFKEAIIQAFADGFADKPDTTFGTMNADVLAANDRAWRSGVCEPCSTPP